MPGEAATVQYSLDAPFEKAVQVVCRALTSHGLLLAGQMDIARNLKRVLGIALPPCRILFVLPNYEKLSVKNIHPWAGVFLPQHVVIAENAAHTTIQILNRVHLDTANSLHLLSPIAETQTQISEALEAVAMRSSLVA